MFLHFGSLCGALQRKETAPTLKTLFYNGKSKVFELRWTRFGVPETFIFIILTHFFCSKVCVYAFWPTFWSATEEGNGSNAQNHVLQCEIKGFWAPRTPLQGPKTMIFDHFNTLFWKKSVSEWTFLTFRRSLLEVKRPASPKPCFTSVYKGFWGLLAARESAKWMNFHHWNTLFWKKVCQNGLFWLLGGACLR